MPKIDLDSIEQINRTGYPAPFDREVAGRWYRRLSPASGISDFGVSHVTLKPGAWSSQRHWHREEDELVVMISGEAVLIAVHDAVRPLFSHDMFATVVAAAREFGAALPVVPVPDTIHVMTDRATVEGVFEVGDRPEVATLLDERGIEVEEQRVVLKREIAAGGRTRAWISGSTVTAICPSE